MEPIRVLVVDDSMIVRRVVMEELSAPSDLEVVGAAVNGKDALVKAKELRPDLIILDIEMPEMDGLTALTHLRADHPKTPVIMFSSKTELGAAATLEALSRGAADFFAKPGGAGGLDASRLVIRDELIPAIRALGRRKRTEPASRPMSIAPSPSPSPPSTAATSRIDLVAIGASTGGPNALAELFAALPANFPVPIVVVQHMPALFTQYLAERLTRDSKIKTVEAKSGLELEPGKAWIAPGDFHLVVMRDGGRVQTQIHQEPPENACRPAVDPLLRSVASTYGPNCLAVILTGMGQDGCQGSAAIRAAGGVVLAQDEASSVVWGMPGHVVRAGLASKVLPLSMLAGEVSRLVSFGRD